MMTMMKSGIITIYTELSQKNHKVKPKTNPRNHRGDEEISNRKYLKERVFAEKTLIR